MSKAMKTKSDASGPASGGRPSGFFATLFFVMMNVGARAARPGRRNAGEPPALPRGRFCRQWAVGLGVAWAAMSGVVVAAETAVVSGPVVELPKFEVLDSRLLPPPESWRYARITGFEILSNVSERETKRFVDDFLLLQMVIEEIMPGLTRGNVPVPTALILCGKGNAFEQFVPEDQTEVRFGRNALFFKNAERSAIVLDFELAELQLSDNSVEQADPYRAFYVQYFRYLIRRSMSKAPPVWFEEGLVQIFAAIDFDRKYISFAQIGDGFGGEKTGDFNRRLQQRALIPFKELLEPGPRSERGTFWSAQCYGFVHMCLYGLNQKYQRAFIKYIQKLDTEEPTEELFKTCFNKSYSQMAMELRGYIDFTNYKSMQYKAKKGKELPKPPAIALVAASDAVVGRLKGETLRLAGHGNLAREAMIAPYVRGERDPRLLAALGLDEKLAGRDERARKFLEAAIAGGVDRATAYLELARLRRDEAKAKPKGPDGQLDNTQVTSVLTPLFTARTMPPAMAEVYSLIAQTWSLSAMAPELSHFEVVVEGVKKFPRDAALVMDAALLAAKRGFPEAAVSLAKLGMRVAKEQGEKDRFEMLANAFDRDESGKAVEGEVQPAEKKGEKGEPAAARTGAAVPTAADLKAFEKPEAK